jgi:hypothetical protein
VVKHFVPDRHAAQTWLLNHVPPPTVGRDWGQVLWSEITRAYPSALSTGSLEAAIASLELHIARAGGMDGALQAMRRCIETILWEVAERAGRDPGDLFVQELASEVVALASKNLQRIAGTYQRRRLSEPTGFRHFPDYGELGDLIAGTRLLKSLAAGDSSGQQSKVSW